MGAIFSVAVARADRIEQLPGATVALAASAERQLDGAPWPEGEVTLLIGAEREGLPTAVLEAASETRSIAITGDSLNAAMAATIALYSCTRKL
jgi:TrmH family RNA methyltransferase